MNNPMNSIVTTGFSEGAQSGTSTPDKGKDVYRPRAMKLKHSAELFVFGKDSTEKFREILERKPTAKTYYPYDKREWDKLG